jgi:hypothetical protein
MRVPSLLLGWLSLLLLLPACDLDFPHQPRVLFVGLDGGDWDVIDPLVEAGYLPVIGALVRAGARADLDCVPAWPQFPCFCPPVWTSIFTGQPSRVHGMLGLYDRADLRRAKALWTVNGERGGVNTLVSVRNSWPFEAEVNWGLSEPGLDVAALEIYDAWGTDLGHPALAEPETLAQPARLFELLRLLPARGERRPAWRPMARDRVAMSSTFRLAWLTRLTSLLLRAPELVVVTLHSPDKSEHVDWASIQDTPGAPIDVAALLAQAEAWDGPVFVPAPLGFGSVASQYLEADRWLGELLARMRYDYVVFASDHGMARNPGPGQAGHHGATTPQAHRGIFAVTGPGVRPGARVAATVLDVAPTVAHLLGLPVADDLPGRVLVEALTPRWQARRPVERVSHW